ncbi:cell surface receptor IPT/TIG domain-containing protein [Flammeovirgaceae bacterium 311]|nr:cell surface receptor IPT/TIG domain-containing protein [Flammeovirgaceae bacterium 311]
MVSFAFLTSCGNDEDDTPNSGQVELLSFGPTGAQHGDDIRFIGRNLNLVDAIELPGATVPRSAFKSQSSEMIILTVPEEAMEGRVILKTPSGDITSKTILSFEVPITITSVTAEARPGSNITIAGTKLNWVEGVMFESDTVKNFVSQSQTELVLTVPATAKTGTLVLLGGGTEPAVVETEEELIVTLPQATTLAPATLHNGENLTITGTDLDLVEAIHFTGVGEAIVTSFVSQSETEIVVTVPANATKGTITLLPASGVEVTTTDEVTMVLPAATAMTPNPIRHDQNLTINGTNLDLVKEVKFKGVGDANVTSFVSKTATQLVVKVPKNASRGTLTLVANSGAEVATPELTIALPVIANMTPSPVEPNQQLTINGTDLDLVKSIEFQGGAVASTFVSKTPTRIVVQVPEAARRGELKFTTIHDYVVETGAQLLIILPVIKTVTPEPVVPGNFLTISGTDLNLVGKVIFEGGAEVTSFTAQNYGQIVLTVPADAKTGNLTLITKSGLEVRTDKRASIGTAEPNINMYIFREELNGDWQKWGGWGTSVQDLENEEQVSRGSKALKISFNDPWGAVQLHPNNGNALAGYTHVVLYVYGTANTTAGIQVEDKNANYLTQVNFDIKAGEWTLVEIPISSLGNISAGVQNLLIKNNGTNPNTFYVDDLGLR